MNKLALFSLISCLVSLPAWTQDLPDMQKGSIAVSLRAWSPLGAKRLEAAEVFFVRIDADNDAYAAPEIITSNHEGKDGRVYLLNVEPGRYAVVGYRTRGGNPLLPADKQWIFAEKNLIDLTTVTVGPGQIAFAGEFVTGGTIWRSKSEDLDKENAYAADDAQVHYLTMMFPEAEEKSTFSRIYGKNPVYLGTNLPTRSPGRVAQAEEEFWKAARKDKDLDTSWDSVTKVTQ